MKGELSDADLAALLARVQRDTGAVGDATLPARLHLAVARPGADRMTAALALLALAAAALVVGAVVMPLVASAFGAAWWLVVVIGAVWVLMRPSVRVA